MIVQFVLPRLFETERKDLKTKEKIGEYAQRVLDKRSEGLEESSSITALIVSLVMMEKSSFTYDSCMNMTTNEFLHVWDEVDKYMEKINSSTSKPRKKGEVVSMGIPEDYDL